METPDCAAPPLVSEPQVPPAEISLMQQESPGRDTVTPNSPVTPRVCDSVEQTPGLLSSPEWMPKICSVTSSTELDVSFGETSTSHQRAAEDSCLQSGHARLEDSVCDDGLAGPQESNPVQASSIFSIASILGGCKVTEPAESLQPQPAESLQPQTAESLQPQSTESLQPQTAESLQPQSTESLQLQPESLLQHAGTQQPAGVIEIVPDGDSEELDIETVSDDEHSPDIIITRMQPVFVSAFGPLPTEAMDPDPESDIDVDALSDDESVLTDNDAVIIKHIVDDIIDLICFQENTEIKREKIGEPTTPGVGKLNRSAEKGKKKTRHIKTEREAEVEAIMAKEKLKFEGWSTEVSTTGPRRRNQLPQKLEPCRCEAGKARGKQAGKIEHYHCSQCDMVMKWGGIIRHEATIHRILRPGLVTYTCPVCHYIVIHLSEYARHISGHYFGQHEKIDDDAKAFLKEELEKCVARGVQIRQQPNNSSKMAKEIYKLGIAQRKLTGGKCSSKTRKVIAEKIQKKAAVQQKQPAVAKQLSKKARKTFIKKTKPAATSRARIKNVPPGKTYQYQVTKKGVVEETTTDCVNVHPELVAGPDGLAQCEKCSFKSHTWSLKRHYVAMHGMRARATYQCQLCCVFTTNRFDFRRHQGSLKHTTAVDAALAKYPQSPRKKPEAPQKLPSPKKAVPRKEKTATKDTVEKSSPQQTSPKEAKRKSSPPSLKTKTKADTAKNVAKGSKKCEVAAPCAGAVAETASPVHLPVKRFAQCMPMTPAEFARSHVGNLGWNGSRHRPLRQQIPTVDGAQDTESEEESKADQESQNATAEPDPEPVHDPPGAGDSGEEDNDYEDDTEVDGAEDQASMELDEAAHDPSLPTPCSPPRIHTTPAVPNPDQPYVKTEIVAPYEEEEMQEAFGQVKVEVESEFVDLGPIDGETMRQPRAEDTDSIDSQLLTPQNQSLNESVNESLNESPELRAVVSLPRNLKLDHIAHQVQRKPGYILAKPTQDGFDFIYLCKRPTSVDTLRDLTPTPGRDSDSDTGGQFSSVITSSGSWGAAVRSLGQGSKTARKRLHPPVVARPPSRAVAVKRTAKKAATPQKKRGVALKKTAKAASHSKPVKAKKKTGKGQTPESAQKKTAKKASAKSKNPRPGKRHSARISGHSETWQSPPRESPPRESPPRESPPRESPPRESLPMDASTVNQAAITEMQRQEEAAAAGAAAAASLNTAGFLTGSAMQPVGIITIQPQPDEYLDTPEPTCPVDMEDTMDDTTEDTTAKRKTPDEAAEELEVLSVALARKRIKKEPEENPYYAFRLGPRRYRSMTSAWNRQAVGATGRNRGRSAFEPVVQRTSVDRGYARDLVPGGADNTSATQLPPLPTYSEARPVYRPPGRKPTTHGFPQALVQPQRQTQAPPVYQHHQQQQQHFHGENQFVPPQTQPMSALYPQMNPHVQGQHQQQVFQQPQHAGHNVPAYMQHMASYPMQPAPGPRQRLPTQPQPLLSEPQPVLNQPQPVPHQIQPVLNAPQPVPNQIQPVLNQPQPVPQPVLNQFQPVLNQIQPVLNAPQPVPNQIQPVLNQPQPVANQIQPVLNTSQPVPNQIQPVLNQFQQVMPQNSQSMAPSATHSQTVDTVLSITPADQISTTDAASTNTSQANTTVSTTTSQPTPTTAVGTSPLTTTAAVSTSPLTTTTAVSTSQPTAAVGTTQSTTAVSTSQLTSTTAVSTSQLSSTTAVSTSLLTTTTAAVSSSQLTTLLSAPAASEDSSKEKDDATKQDFSIFNLQPGTFAQHPQLQPGGVYSGQQVRPRIFSNTAMHHGSGLYMSAPPPRLVSSRVKTIAVPKPPATPIVSINVDDDDDDIMIVDDPLVPKPKQLPPRRLTPRKTPLGQSPSSSPRTTPQKTSLVRPHAFVSPVKNTAALPKTPAKTPPRTATGRTVIDLTDEPARRKQVAPPASTTPRSETAGVVDLTSGGEAGARSVSPAAVPETVAPVPETVVPVTETITPELPVGGMSRPSDVPPPPDGAVSVVLPNIHPRAHLQDLDSVGTDTLWAELVSRGLLVECVCGQAFKNNTLYYIHRQTHNTDDPLRCGACSHRADSWCAFAGHLMDHSK